MGEFDKYKDVGGEDYFGLDIEKDAKPAEVSSEDGEKQDAGEFVIGSGFDLGEDYEAIIRARKGREVPPPVIKQRPLSERDGVDLKRINRDEKREQKRNNMKHRRGIKTFVWVLIVLAIAGMLSYGIISVFTDVLGMGKDKICVVIVEQGMTTSQIADLLKDEGAIDHPLIFRAYLKLKKQDGTLRHGAYQFKRSLGYDGIIEVLQKGNEKETVEVRIPEGAGVQKIAELLEENGVCTVEQFKTAMKKGTYNYDFVKAIPKEKVYYLLEGYLYPDTYAFFTGESQANAEYAIDRMLSNFNDKLLERCPNYEEDIKGLKEYGIDSLHEVMSLASIVELGCNGFPEEMDNVAAVFLGRLVWSEPHYLGSTPTFYYPDNRYNTNNYSLYGPDGKKISDPGYEGLPPGPQSSMTVDAIEAVLNPNTEYIGKYYYFVTDKNSKFYYNNSYKQHQNTINSLVNQGLWAG